jgi:hypothetical protein
MPEQFAAAFAALRPVLAKYADHLTVKADTPTEYALVTKRPSPFPQHKGHPMDFGAIRSGKAYVSFHLMPIYIYPALAKSIPPALKKRMQGKSCFNFKAPPEPDLLAGLARLTEASFKAFSDTPPDRQSAHG